MFGADGPLHKTGRTEVSRLERLQLDCHVNHILEKKRKNIYLENI